MKQILANSVSVNRNTITEIQSTIIHIALHKLNLYKYYISHADVINYHLFFDRFLIIVRNKKV